MAEDIILNIKLEGAKVELNNLTLLQEAINSLSQEKKNLAKQEKDLTKAISEGTVTEKEAAATAKSLAEQQVKNNLILKETKKEFQDSEKAVISNAKANRVNEGSIAQMRLEVSKAQKQYVNLSKAERDNEKIGGALQKQIKEQNDELKELEKNVGINGRSIGDYGQAVEGVLPLMGGFGQQIQGVIGNLGQIKTAIGKFSTAQGGLLKSTKGSTKGLKAFRVALISTGIGAIVVALGALVAAFLSTQRGVDAVTKVLRPLQEIFNSILGVVQTLATSGLDKLKKAFSDPKQAVIDLATAIKDNLITRVLAIPKLVRAAAGAIIGSFKLVGLGIKKVLADVPLIGTFIDKKQLEKDLEEAKEQTLSSFKELADAGIEYTIGVDADSVKEAAGEVGDFFAEAAARGSQIDELTKQIERASISLNREREKGLLIFAQQKKIAEDTNATTQEQLAAAGKAQQALKDVTKLEIDQLNRQVKLAELKAIGNDTDIEGQKEIQDLIAERERVEAQATEKSIEIRNKSNSIAKATEDKRLKAIDDIAKAETKAADEKIKQQSELIDKQIQGLELARQLELATIDETNAEKLQKERDLLDAIGVLRVEKAKLNGEDVATVELENKIAKAEQEKEVQAEIDEQKLADEQVVEERKEAIKNSAIQAGEQVAQEIFNNENRRIDEGLSRQVDALNLKREAGEISEEEFNKKRLELDKQAFKDRKRLAQKQNLVDFAVAAGKTLATYGLTPAGAAALIPLGIQAATQAGIIASQKFAKGGIIHGASHAFGGVDLGNNQEGEGGEAIINKRSTAKHLPLLSAINQDGGGVPLGGIASPSLGALSKFGNGGITNNVTNQSSQIDLNDLETRIVASMGAIKVQNVASETTEVANRVQSIEDSASF